MKSSQWSVLGLFMIFMTFLFRWLDSIWGENCNILETVAVTKGDIIACMNAEMYEPFIWIFGFFSIALFINAFIAAKKEKIAKTSHKMY